MEYNLYDYIIDEDDNSIDNYIRKTVIEKDISITVLSCALNISDKEMFDILISQDILEKLDCMQYGEFLRVLEIYDL